MISFEKITRDTLYIVLEMVNSNTGYNLLENGEPNRTLHDIEKEFLKTNTESYLIKVDDTYIGVIDYMADNPNDHHPWLGLLMIHGEYQGFRYGTEAYHLFEKEWMKQGQETIRIGVMKENVRAHAFWKGLGFTEYRTVIGQMGKEIICYQKSRVL